MFSDVMEGHSSHILTETDQAVEGTKRSHRVTIYETFWQKIMYSFSSLLRVLHSWEILNTALKMKSRIKSMLMPHNHL